MCNHYQQRIVWAEYCRVMVELALKISTHQAELLLPQADDIRVNEPAPIMRAAGAKRLVRARSPCLAWGRRSAVESYLGTWHRRQVRQAMQSPLLLLAILPNHDHRPGAAGQPTVLEETPDERVVEIGTDIVGSLT